MSLRRDEMLPDWMIDAIEREKQERQREYDRPRLEIPEDWRPFPEKEEEKSNRGVVTFNI